MSVSVTSLLLKTLENATKEYARECVRRCSVEYGFDATEALLNLDLENLRVGVKEMKKRSSGKKEAKEVPEKKAKAMKEAIASAENNLAYKDVSRGRGRGNPMNVSFNTALKFRDLLDKAKAAAGDTLYGQRV